MSDHQCHILHNNLPSVTSIGQPSTTIAMPTSAQVVIPTLSLGDDIPFFSNVLKMRMESIYPAYDPAVAVFSGHGIRDDTLDEVRIISHTSRNP